MPGALVALVSVLFGRLDAGDVTGLERTAISHGYAGRGVFRFVGNDLSTSLRQSIGLPRSVQFASVATGVVLLALAGWLLLGFQPHVRRVLVDATRDDRVIAAAYALVVLGLVVLHLTGIDWLRWVATFGLLGTVAILFVSLAVLRE